MKMKRQIISADDTRFTESSRLERKKIIQTYSCKSLIYLAEKVETRKDYKQAAIDF
jgi:c-di-GMP-related signal transduction protein